MNQIIFMKDAAVAEVMTADTIVSLACRAMECSLSFMQTEENENAHICMGEAGIWAELYFHLTGEHLEDVNKDYEQMLDEYIDYYRI